MEIERINENTVKFYISYIDIEDRGFEREEIWYNRERSEQLFWQMMDEVNYKEDFSVEGPLWIQVQALEKGLEIIVTKAQVGKNGTHIEPITENNGELDIALNQEKIEMKKEQKQMEKIELSDESIWMTAKFADLEDVIQLSYYFQGDYEDELDTVLYYYKDNYFIYVEIPHELLEVQEEIISQILEFSIESNVTYHVLDEYGQIVFDQDIFTKTKANFSIDM